MVVYGTFYIQAILNFNKNICIIFYLIDKSVICRRLKYWVLFNLGVMEYDQLPPITLQYQL